jgi:hypothetical protein
MDSGQPKSSTLRELRVEMREGYALYAPILIRVRSEAADRMESTIDRTMTMSKPLDWAEQYTREYANEKFIMVGDNTLKGGLEQSVTIGRSRRCDVKIENDSVSKVHATIAFDRSNGDYFVVDEGSRNGTCINGEPVDANARMPLWPGAYVSFGDGVFVFIDPPTLRKLSKLAV